MSELYGVVGVFRSPDRVKNAALRLREKGYSAFETYTPYPVDGLQEIVHPGPALAMPLTMLAGAIAGVAVGYWIQYWDEAVNYPINVGGRPHNSWPAFTVSTFEFMVLFAITAGLLALLIANGLPRLHHPLFDASSFARASRDRFVICIKARDPQFDAEEARELLRGLGAERTEWVPR